MKTIKNFSLTLTPLLLVAILALFAAGCMTAKLKQGDAAYVYVTANGVTTFWGEAVAIEELPAKLKRAGATAHTTIKLVAQGEVSERILASIAGGLGRNGLRRVLIVGNEKPPEVLLRGSDKQLQRYDDGARDVR